VVALEENLRPAALKDTNAASGHLTNIARLSDRQEEACTSVSRFQGQLKDSESKIAELYEHSQATVAMLQGQVDEAHSSIADLQEQLDHARETITKLRGQLEEQENTRLRRVIADMSLNSSEASPSEEGLTGTSSMPKLFSSEAIKSESGDYNIKQRYEEILK